MAGDGSARSKQQGLQQAASVIFALVAIVPLLIFAFTLHSVGAMRSTQAQVSLTLALAISLLGFWLFRSMLGRMAEVVQALAAAVEQAGRTRRPASPTGGAAPVAGAPAAAARPMTAASIAAAGAPVRKPADDNHGIPGVGHIREIAEVARTMDTLWKREAEAHVGKHVQISVANSRDPLLGIISEVSDDGLILDQDDGTQHAVAYRRVTGIDRVTGQG
ncbi:MAG: hypothetical protein DMD78_15930 [Candidatus Rokuibacteriota bacterium]|nr:MAG: hypothetical protein DMD78_15930 [Candidatus Rokubacteria bacterium]